MDLTNVNKLNLTLKWYFKPSLHTWFKHPCGCFLQIMYTIYGGCFSQHLFNWSSL